LFLNRRGSSTHVFCRECGYVALCPHCARPMTAHAGDTWMLCHTCGYRRAIPKICPECNSRAIRQVGIGTETVENAVRDLLPNARVLRWDVDSRREGKLSEIVLTHFRNHHYDILVGTQMVSKGLDFPLVNLVGMVLADVGLNLPDYRSPERIFQVLTQVAGRAGRTGQNSRVILQTYQPEHYAIQAAASHNYAEFYRQEMEYRRSLGYPPFAQIIRLETSDPMESAARQRMEDLSIKLHQWVASSGFTRTEIMGPVPCYFARQNDRYRWQVVIRGTDPLTILKPHRDELADIRVEVNPPNLL
jgi:primosomal protein N' (replication factor Y) (superfamily II helicase)